MGRRGWLDHMDGDGGGVIKRFKKPSQPHNTPYIYIYMHGNISHINPVRICHYLICYYVL